MKYVNQQRQAAHSRPNRHNKFRSFPNNLAAAVHTHGFTEPLLMSRTVPIPDIPFTASVPVLRPRPLYPAESHSYSDPLPARRKLPSQPLRLPHALVISGLEYTTDVTQRTFANVLSERQVVIESKQNVAGQMANHESDDNHGIWALPDGFITVYVCPLNLRERPPIHKALVRVIQSLFQFYLHFDDKHLSQLDKFAMSSNIFIAQEIRHNFRALPFTPSPRSFHLHAPSHSNPGTPSPSHPMSLPQTYTPPAFTKPLPLHSRSSTHFNPPQLPENILPCSFLKALNDAHHRVHISHTLSIYLADIFSATRHNSRLDATLLTLRATKDAEALIRASRVIGTDLTGMELLRPVTQADDLSDAGSHKVTEPADHTYDAGRGSAGYISDNAQTANVLDVSEVDVARIAPRVISHRVRVRDGPEDEVLSSALFGATFKSPIPSTDIWDDRLTVKDVLVQILSEV